MAGLTKEELKEFIKGTTIPMIQDIVGKQVAEVVRLAVEKASKETNRGGIEALLLGGPGGGFDGRQGNGNVQKADFVGRYCRVIAAAARERKDVMTVAKEWKDTAMVSMFEEGAKVKAMAAGDALSGGYLVPEQFSTEVIEFLRPASIVRRLGPLTVPMTTGTLNMPKITGGSTGSYMGENTNITASQLASGNVKLTFKKLAALVPISNDLLRYSAPGADAVVRTDLVRAMAAAENLAFIRSNGTAANPKGIRYWAATVNTANSTVSLANTVSDMGGMIVALMNFNIPLTKPAWMMAPRIWNYLMTLQNSQGFYVFREEMMTGKLWGYPFGVSTHVPINLSDHGGTIESELYFVDFDDVVLGEALSLMVDASMEAAYVSGTSTISAFSQDQTVIRAIQEHDLVMRRNEAAAVLNGVNWR